MGDPSAWIRVICRMAVFALPGRPGNLRKARQITVLLDRHGWEIISRRLPRAGPAHRDRQLAGVPGLTGSF